MPDHNIQSDLESSGQCDADAKCLQTPEGWILCWGHTLPANGDPGYAHGGLFQYKGAAHNGGTLFVNVGTQASCEFAWVNLT